MFFCSIRILVDVECTIGQSRCTAEIKTICFRIDDARIGTSYRRSNAICMRVEASSNTAHALGTVIAFISVTINLRQVFIDRIVFDVMSLIIQGICIGFDLGIKGTQVLASRIVCRHIIQFLASFCNRRIIVVQRLARYQLVGSRSIRSFFRCAFRECICTKSRAPGIFIGFLLVCCRIGFCNGFSIFTDGIGLQISANVRCVRFGIRFQLFHDHGIMGINAVSGFDEAIIVGRLIRCIFCSNRILSVIV